MTFRASQSDGLARMQYHFAYSRIQIRINFTDFFSYLREITHVGLEVFNMTFQHIKHGSARVQLCTKMPSKSTYQLQNLHIV